jgi:predicted DNA-binding transcriptional regulator YafY
MRDQRKLLRLLQFLTSLSGGFGQSRQEIADRLEVSPRTVYRYLETIREAGFIIEHKNGYYHIPKQNSNKELNNLLYFSSEESYVLQQAISYIDENSAIKQSLVSKLYSLYSSRHIAHTILQRTMGEKVRKLCDAIENKQQVTLKAYRSANSSKIADRVVEPFAFTTNYISLWGYDVAKQQNRVFKTARIGEVLPSETKWQYPSAHHAAESDIFRVAGDNPVYVKIKMRLRAAELLKEEYPLATKAITPYGKEHYIYEGRVNGFDAVSRFTLGLMDEVEVLEPEELKDFLNAKIERRMF